MLSKNEQIVRMLNDAVKEALLIIDRNINKWGERIPDFSDAGVYMLWDKDNIHKATSWRQGFGVGIPWLCYRYTGDEKYKEYANRITNIFCGKPYLPDQCQGVLYLPSCVTAFECTGNELAKKCAIGAADVLKNQFNPIGNYFYAFRKYRNYVVDSAFNSVIMHWASRVTGDASYYECAKLHLKTEIANSIRPDGSTCHQQWFDTKGNPTDKTTAQGYSDNSCWSRGQAWAMLGFALHHLFTQDEEYLSAFKKLTPYFFDHLNPDGISCWDMVFNGEEDIVDTAASVIAVCAVMEMASQLPDDDEIKKYKEKAINTLVSVVKKYSVSYDDYIDGLIVGGVDNMNSGRYDEALIYGDYFYLEALIRAITDFESVWQ